MPGDVLIQVTISLLVLQLPLIITAGIGFWFAATRRAVQGRVARFAKWGFGLLIAFSIVTIVMSVLRLQLGMVARIQSPEEAGQALTWLQFGGLATYPLFIGGIVLVARAVFADR